jgi:hypothetical protein
MIFVAEKSWPKRTCEGPVHSNFQYGASFFGRASVRYVLNQRATDLESNRISTPWVAGSNPAGIATTKTFLLVFSLLACR